MREVHEDSGVLEYGVGVSMALFGVCFRPREFVAVLTR
jgi:hypothetical protein